MATDLKTETILSNVKGYLVAISTSSSYWHTAKTVRRRHLADSQIATSVTPIFTVQGGPITASDEYGGLGKGRKGQSFQFTVRGYDKIGSIESEAADTEAQRLIKDIGRAVMSNDGLGCQAVGTTTVVNATPLIIDGQPGFIGAEVTFEVPLEVLWNE
jgi:hypothetical protein